MSCFLILNCLLIQFCSSRLVYKRVDSEVIKLPPIPRLNLVDRCNESLIIGLTLNDRYKVEKRIGRGGNSLVFLASYKGQKVAIKCLLADIMPESMSNLMELRLLRSLKHPNIVKLLDWFSGAGNNFIVTEFCELDLHEAIFNLRFPVDIKQVFVQILDAVAFLHQLNIFHQDLKPANILLTNSVNPIVKLTDFGATTTDKLSNRVIWGTSKFVSPEIYAKLKGYSLASNDVWSLGVILFNLLTRESPWSQPNIFNLKITQSYPWRVSSMEFTAVENFKIKFNFSDPVMKVFKAVFNYSELRPTVLELKSMIENTELNQVSS